MTAPDAFPLLRKGTGKTPKDGGCLIQVVGWLNDGVSWRDDTPCVLRILRNTAIRINDIVPDRMRNQLLQYADRLIGTGGNENDKEVTDHLVKWCVADAKASAERARSAAAYSAAAYSAAADAAYSADAAAYSAADAAYSAADAAYSARIAFLGRMLDEYNRFTGRKPTGVAPEKWQAVAEAMSK